MGLVEGWISQGAEEPQTTVPKDSLDIEDLISGRQFAMEETQEERVPEYFPGGNGPLQGRGLMP